MDLFKWNKSQDLNKDSIKDSNQEIIENSTNPAPYFTNIERLRGNCDNNNIWWFYLNDIYKILENTSGSAQINLCVKKFPGIILPMPCNKEWNAIDKKWEDCKIPIVLAMIPELHLEQVTKFIIGRTRKSGKQKLELCRKLNIVIPESQLSIPIECSVLDFFTQACPFAVELQYRLGKYKLDAFIPRLKIAIQIDEDGHCGYNEFEEKEYDTVIRDHRIICIRFVPNQDQPLESALKLIHLVWQRTLSPDFSEFRVLHSLG